MEAGVCTVLVTGGSGLLGSGLKNVVSRFMNPLSSNTDSPSLNKLLGDFSMSNGLHRIDWTKAKFVWASRADADLSDATQTRKLFESIKPTHVVHLAARVGGLYANIDHNIEFLRDNLMINDNVIQMCHELKVSRAIFCLSTCIFPKDAPLPLTEDAIHKGEPHSSNEGYAMAKRVLESLCRFYRDAFDYDWQCVVPTNLYGPNDNFRLEDAHVIPAMIHKCYRAKYHNEAFILSGSGNCYRHFLYSCDAALIILLLLMIPKRHKYSSIIIAPDATEEYSITDTAQLVAKHMKYTGEIQFDTSKPGGIFRKTASNARLKEVLGSENLTSTSLDAGIEETVKWFVSSKGKLTFRC